MTEHPSTPTAWERYWQHLDGLAEAVIAKHRLSVTGKIAEDGLDELERIYRTMVQHERRKPPDSPTPSPDEATHG